MVPKWLVKAAVEDFISELSAEELVKILGGPNKVVDIFTQGFRMLCPEQKDRVRKIFLGNDDYLPGGKR